MKVLNRQIETVRNLAVPPYGYDDVREYRVEQIDRTPSLMVTRVYSRVGLSIAYHECLIVGPRGGTKTVYNSFY